MYDDEYDLGMVCQLGCEKEGRKGCWQKVV